MATNSIREDFLLGEDGDFPLEDTVINGEYLPTPYGPSDDQHKIDCVFFYKNSLKQYPLFGFGIVLYDESEYDADNVYSNLAQQMESDGYKLKNGAIFPKEKNGFSIDTDLIVANY